MNRTTSALAYGSVAIGAAVMSAIATWGTLHFVASADAQTAPPPATVQLLVQPLPDLPGREVRITLLDRPPGNASPAHHHPGHHTFGYIVEGTYELGIDGQPTKILHAGDTFYEPPGAIHSVSKNASSDKPLKIVVFMVADASQPSTVNEP